MNPPMHRMHLCVTLLLLMLASSAGATPKSAYGWTKLGEGFYYATYSFAIAETERATMHAFEIDLARFRVGIITAADEATGASAAELATQSKALLVINGGFFTPEHRSIGLLVRDGKQLNPAHNTSWWSIFAIRNGKPAIAMPREFTMGPDVSMAIQAGPRLVIDGAIPKLKESVAARSAIGITRDGKVVIAITSGVGISMKELAKRMSASRYEGGLECPNAMALDGGSSSQLYVKVGAFERSLEGLARVTNGVGVFGK
jgi:uncharacterized protein YigE (DUF2233 family)